MKEKQFVLKRLENELRSIRKWINKEGDPVRKAKMISVYVQMSIALTGKEL